MRGLLGSRVVLPYRAVCTHLDAMGGWKRLRPHSAGSTVPHLWPTSSSWDRSLDDGPVLLLIPFRFHLAVEHPVLRRATSTRRPVRHDPHFWIRCSPSEHRRDLNPPEPHAAQRTLCDTPTPRRPSPRASLPSPSGTIRAPAASLRRTPGAASTASGLVSRCPPPGGLYDGDDEASGFPGNPPARMPRAPTPARSPPPRPLRGGDVAFRPTHDVGPRTQCMSGLNHAAYGLPVNASRPGSPQAHASLGSGWRPTLAGWDWIPTGFRTRFQRSHHGILSPLTGLSRHTRWCMTRN